MPLSHGKSKAAFSRNVAELMHAGHPQKQSLAIAYKEQGEHKAEGGQVEDQDKEAMLDAVADELLQAIEHKDKKMLREALTALCLHIADEDKEQDMQEPQE